MDDDEPEAGPGAGEPEDQGLKRFMLFQFAVLSGFFALGVPGLFVLGGADELHSLYYPALAMHLFFLYVLYRFDRGTVPWIVGFLLVVVVLPWCCWALREFLGFSPYLTGPILFSVLALGTIWWATTRGAATSD